MSKDRLEYRRCDTLRSVIGTLVVNGIVTMEEVKKIRDQIEAIKKKDSL